LGEGPPKFLTHI